MLLELANQHEERTDSGMRFRRALLVGIPFLVAVIAVAVALTVRAGSQTPSNALPLNGHWTATSLHGDVTSLLALPGQPATLLAATTSGVWRSTDAGATWQADGVGMQGRAVFVLTDTPGSTSVWAGSFDGAVYRRGGTGAPVKWQRVSPVLHSSPSFGATPVYSLAVSPAQGHPIYVGSMGAIFGGLSIDGDRTWQWKRLWQAPGGAGSASASAAVTSLLVASWDAHLVVASLFEAKPPVLVSRDNGHTWTSDASNLPAPLPVQDLAAGDAKARQIFLTTMGGGVWQHNGDDAWQEIGAGLPQNHAMPLIAAAPQSAGVLYAGTMASGVYEKNGKNTWLPLGSGLTGGAATVTSLVETQGAHTTLIAATSAGVYRYIVP
jgi:hypothetical protein